MEAQEFGAFIQLRRKNLGLSQADLAEKLHVTAKAVSRWERGVGFPDIKLLQPLADALDITIAELMQSQLLQEDISKETAAELVSETIETVSRQEKMSVKKKIRLIFGAMIIVAVQILLLYLYYAYDIQPRWISFALYLVAFSGGQVCLRGWYCLVTNTPLPEPKKIHITGKLVLSCASIAGGLFMIVRSGVYDGIGPLNASYTFVAAIPLLVLGLLGMATRERE